MNKKQQSATFVFYIGEGHYGWVTTMGYNNLLILGLKTILQCIVLLSIFKGW